jgi:hypothetical protein
MSPFILVQHRSTCSGYSAHNQGDIFEGTSEIRQLVIARAISGMHIT